MQEQRAIKFSENNVPAPIHHGPSRARWAPKFLGAIVLASGLSAANAQEATPAAQNRAAMVSPQDNLPRAREMTRDEIKEMLPAGLICLAVLATMVGGLGWGLQIRGLLNRWDDILHRSVLKRDTEQVVCPAEAQKKKYRTALVACRDSRTARIVWDRLDARNIIPMHVSRAGKAKFLVRESEGMDLLVTDMRGLGKIARGRDIDHVIVDAPSRTVSLSLGSPDLCPGLGSELLADLGKEGYKLRE